MKPDALSTLFDFLSSENIVLHSGQREKVERFYRLLLEWSPKMNLVSCGDIGHLPERHFLTSFYFVKVLRQGCIEDNHKIMDLGSGAGFPGIILSIIFEDNEIVLVDSSRKKSLFLHRVKQELDLKAEILCERAEKMPFKYHSGFDIVCARAVSSLRNLIEWTRPLLKRHGQLITIKGPQYLSELGTYETMQDEMVVFKVDPSWIEYSHYMSEKIVIKLENLNG